MMFFSMISLQNISYYSAINNFHSCHLNNNKALPNKPLSIKMNLAYVFNTPEELAKGTQLVSEKKFFKTNPSSELFRNLWHQDIFLSINHKSLYKYNMDINSVNIFKHQKKQKSLLSKFSKALFSGSIQCSLTSSLNTPKKTFFSVNYSWSKVFQLQIFKAQNLFINSNHIKTVQALLDYRIKTQCLPVFTISNHLGQMIIAEPSKSFYGTQYKQDSDNVISKMYHGFFFMNYEDAEEYLSYIQNKYNLNNQSLKIFTCDFNTFYRIMGSLSKEISFRLIPDLNEVSKLIKKHRYNKNLLFYKKQKQGRRFFQGQPLYFVKYNNGYLRHVLSNKEYKLLFTNYNEALKISSLLQNNFSPPLLQKPQIIVYNLEQFINDQLDQAESYKDRFLVVPSKDSYVFTKKYHIYRNDQLIRNKCMESLSYINLWMKRVLWSLTSRKSV
uniref:Uncharacterized protein n=1 Tax=Porolithon onkodes TaxID=231751 RepID=A0A2Z2KVK2_9FLOR|nr:hypothetical protein [Porolithon onkodes]ASB29787.1 hypothetical protein [Porolithon onkodes]